MIIVRIKWSNKLIEAQKDKYHSLYMDMAVLQSGASCAERKKVGSIIVLTTGTMASGWNGMPAGMDNCCEDQNGDTKPEVIHAERNALDKLSKEGISPMGAIVFITLSPCMECAKSLYSVGVTEVYYLSGYKESSGIDFLNKMGVKCERFVPVSESQKRKSEVDCKSNADNLLKNREFMPVSNTCGC
jgi:dCMP deaminase